MKSEQKYWKRWRPWPLLAACLLLCSCGELFNFEPTVSPYHMQLDHHEYYIMAGDTGLITPLFSPDTISNMTVYWMSDNPSVATFHDNRLVGVSVGETTVTGVSIEYQIFDTCHVCVTPAWAVDDAEGYPYDMVFYTWPTFNGQPITSRQDVAVFCGSEVRGVGIWKERMGIRYMEIRVYSRYNPSAPYDPELNPQDPLYPDEPEQQPEQLVFRLYDHSTAQVHELPDTVSFDGEAHGTLSQLYPLDF